MWNLIKPRLSVLLFFTGFSMLNTSANADHIDFEFKPYKAVYKLTAKGFYVGDAYFTLEEIEDGVWEYRSTAKPSGFAAMLSDESFNEISRFTMQDSQVLPLGSEYKRNGKKKEHSKVIYDWQNKQATFELNGQSRSVSLEDGQQDRSSIMPALMWSAATGAAHTKFPVIDKHMRIHHHEAKPVGTTKLKKLGKVNTVHYHQTDETKRTVDAWLSPDLNYVPVKVEQLRKGKSQVRMTLLSIEWQ